MHGCLKLNKREIFVIWMQAIRGGRRKVGWWDWGGGGVERGKPFIISVPDVPLGTETNDFAVVMGLRNMGQAKLIMHKVPYNLLL